MLLQRTFTDKKISGKATHGYISFCLLNKSYFSRYREREGGGGEREREGEGGERERFCKCDLIVFGKKEGTMISFIYFVTILDLQILISDLELKDHILCSGLYGRV
jgi:hypothetical protein